MDGEYVGALNLRGLTIPVFRGGGRFFAILAGKSVFVCQESESWEKALREKVERRFGEISEISPGAWIGFFDNGGAEDVGLWLGGRLLKVWLCAKRPSDADVARIESEARAIIAEILRISPGSLPAGSLNYSEPEIHEVSADPEGGSN